MTKCGELITYRITFEESGADFPPTPGSDTVRAEPR